MKAVTDAHAKLKNALIMENIALSTPDPSPRAIEIALHKVVKEQKRAWAE